MITDQTNYSGALLAILSWLKDYAGIAEVVFGNQPGTRPAKPYATILVISEGNKTGFDDVVKTYDIPSQAVQKTHLGPRTMTIQLMVYTDPASDLVTKEASHYLNFALACLELDDVRDLFRVAGIAVLDHSAPNKLDQQLGERWERRSQTDLTFSYTSKIFDDGGSGSGNWIETVVMPTESNGTATFNE